MKDAVLISIMVCILYTYHYEAFPKLYVGLLYDDPTPSHSQQIAYKNFG